MKKIILIVVLVVVLGGAGICKRRRKSVPLGAQGRLRKAPSIISTQRTCRLTAPTLSVCTGSSARTGELRIVSSIPKTARGWKIDTG